MSPSPSTSTRGSRIEPRAAAAVATALAVILMLLVAPTKAVAADSIWADAEFTCSPTDIRLRMNNGTDQPVQFDFGFETPGGLLGNLQPRSADTVAPNTLQHLNPGLYNVFPGTSYVFTVLADGVQVFRTTLVAPTCGDYMWSYVAQVYEDLLGRAPDPDGHYHWAMGLQLGASYSTVANSITASREFRSGLIRDSYDWYLGREPDRAGLEHWLQRMAMGMHIEEMEAGFIASQEFFNNAGRDDRTWIRDLYSAVLSREAGPSEVEHWKRALDSGVSRMSVARGFVYSTEYLTGVVDGYYLHLLDRHIDPSGQRTWVRAIQTGSRDEQIIAAIVSSQEYRGRIPNRPAP